MKIVAASLDLNELRVAFMGTQNFVSLPCWASITHLVIRDFVNIFDGEVSIAGLADRFGWIIYASILRRLMNEYPKLNVVIEFHEIISRDILYGKIPLPCPCKLVDFVNDTFPRNVGLCFTVHKYMSLANFEGDLGTKMAYLRKDLNLWLNVENPEFKVSNADINRFDKVVLHRPSRIAYNRLHSVIFKIEKPFSDAPYAYYNCAGMMTCPLFKDGPDATVLPFAKVLFKNQHKPSMLNTCLKLWHDLSLKAPSEQCAKCALPNSVCAVQSSAPGSCSTQTHKDVETPNTLGEDEQLQFPMED